MRETQMKKIIALAVATAFVAPAYAADVTVSGDVEYYFISATGGKTYSGSGDQDVTVSASEDLGNGMTVSASLEMDGADGSTDTLVSDSSLTISGGFGSISVGDAVDTAAELVDEQSATAEQGGTDNALDHGGTAHTVSVTPNLGVEGLAVTGSYSTTTFATASAKSLTSYRISYTVGPVTANYGIIDKDEDEDQLSVTSVKVAMGPLTVGYDSIENESFTTDNNTTNVGVSYNYGQGNLFAESGSNDNAGTITDTTAYGISYKMGAVNMYVVANSEDASTDTDSTYFGVEYAF
jgi:hypothetical protein